MSCSPTSTRSGGWPVDNQNHLREDRPCGFGVRVGFGTASTSDLKGGEKQLAQSPGELEMETTVAADPARGGKGKERETDQSSGSGSGFREQYDVIAMAEAPGKRFQYWRDRRPLSQELCVRNLVWNLSRVCRADEWGLDLV